MFHNCQYILLGVRHDRIPTKTIHGHFIGAFPGIGYARTENQRGFDFGIHL